MLKLFNLRAFHFQEGPTETKHSELKVSTHTHTQFEFSLGDKKRDCLLHITTDWLSGKINRTNMYK